jgi:hypothetical protein
LPHCVRVLTALDHVLRILLVQLLDVVLLLHDFHMTQVGAGMMVVGSIGIQMADMTVDKVAIVVDFEEELVSMVAGMVAIDDNLEAEVASIVESADMDCLGGAPEDAEGLRMAETAGIAEAARMTGVVDTVAQHSMKDSFGRAFPWDWP